jgi:hypothetical protein
MQVYGDTAMKKTADSKWVTRFSEGKEEQVSLTKRDQDGQQRAELKKILQNQNFVKLCVKIVG